MNSQVCVTCRNEKPVNHTDNRLVTESCGHVKCMDCLLLEKAGCETCLAEKSLVEIAEASDTNDGFAGDTEAAPAEKLTEDSCIELQNTDKGLEVINNGCEEVTELQLAVNCEQILLEDLSKRKKLETSHIKIETDANGKSYLCTVCKKRFHARSHVAYHAYCNGQSKPYACRLCPQSFASQSHYKYHMRVHLNERPYVCDVCGQNFIQSSKLQRHKLKHTKEKKHTCLQCNKAFNNMTALRKHALIHTEERPYACPTCARLFRDPSNLQKHVKKHNNYIIGCSCIGVCAGRCGALRGGAARRRHECARCPQAFHSSKDLRRHAAVHTDSKPFRCKVCERNFRRKDNLERHIRNTHPNYSTATAVECDQTVLQQISNGTKAKLEESSEKSKLEVLNPLPPLPLELIKTLKETELKRNAEEIDKSYILVANHARQSVIVGKPIEKPVDSPCEYVHKIRKANSMAHQKKLQLPPIDETKMRELTSDASLNCVVTPPKDVKKFMKILYEDDKAEDAEVSPQMHWRKIKLNQDGIKNHEIEG